MWFWEISLLKFPIPIVLNLKGCRKCKILLWENVWKSPTKCLKISQKLHGDDRKHIKVCKEKKKKQIKNLKSDRWVIFHPYANFNCLYLKMGLCNLFPVLLECITITEVLFMNPTFTWCSHDQAKSLKKCFLKNINAIRLRSKINEVFLEQNFSKFGVAGLRNICSLYAVQIYYPVREKLCLLPKSAGGPQTAASPYYLFVCFFLPATIRPPRTEYRRNSTIKPNQLPHQGN